MSDLDGLTDEQKRLVKDYVAALVQQAEAAGEPCEEQMERDGIAWYCKVGGNGLLETLVVEQVGEE